MLTQPSHIIADTSHHLPLEAARVDTGQSHVTEAYLRAEREAGLRTRGGLADLPAREVLDPRGEDHQI